MRFTSMAALINKIYLLCAKNDHKYKTAFCCKDFATDLDDIEEKLTNKESFRIMVRNTGFESQNYRIDGFKSFLKPISYKIYNISYRSGSYHLIAAKA